MTHIDLFSGIGGFAYAADQVWGDVEHTFVEWEPFCQQVLKKHWPESEVYGDIRQFATDTGRKHGEPGSSKGAQWEAPIGSVTAKETKRPRSADILTGGFPCQPFSAAGVRRGTADDRYLWPEMHRVIQACEPTWVIAENVRGLATWEQGVVLEQVCLDLEASGYEVQPLIIPAVAVNAPHRRDRIWFVAHRTGDRRQRRGSQAEAEERYSKKPEFSGKLSSRPERQDSNADDTQQPRLEGHSHANKTTQGRQEPQRPNASPSWERDWTEVATEFCSVDDGLPVELDEFKLTKAQHRKEQLKAYGNAIVPQVAMQIMTAIKEAQMYNDETRNNEGGDK